MPSNGESALDLAREHCPDVIVTDYNMPLMNGLELISSVKDDDNLDAIPVALLIPEENKKNKFLYKKCCFYMQKSFLPQKLKYLLIERLYETIFG
jgi:CheY-like chemotaxis protein